MCKLYRISKHFFCVVAIICNMLLMSCHEKPSKSLSAVKIDSLQTTTCVVPSNDTALLLQTYYLSCAYPCDGKTLIMGYNYKSNSLDVFSGSSVIKKIQLDQHGENAIPGKLIGLTAVSKDSILVFDGIAFSLMTSEGNVLMRHKEKDFVFVGNNYAMHSASMGWYGKDVLLYPVDVDGTFRVRGYNTSKKAVEKEWVLDLPDCNPGGKNSYADMRYPNVSFVNGMIVYNYAYDSSIKTIDLRTGEKKTYSVSSQYADASLKPYKGEINADEMLDYDWSNAHYYEVSYLPQLDVYVRPMLGGIDTKKYSDTSKVMDARKLYLSFMDKDFNLIGEYGLKEKRYNNFHGWCVLPDAVAAYADNILGDNTGKDLVYDVLKPHIAENH